MEIFQHQMIYMRKWFPFVVSRKQQTNIIMNLFGDDDDDDGDGDGGGGMIRSQRMFIWLLRERNLACADFYPSM